MPGGNYSRQFKLGCVHKVAAGQKRSAQRCREQGLAQEHPAAWENRICVGPDDAFDALPPLTIQRLDRLVFYGQCIK